MSMTIKKNTPNTTALVAGIAALVLGTSACASINKSINIEDGAESRGASSVNGSITVGENATVTGNLSTVNGTIRVGEGASIEGANTVNGSLRIARGVKSESLETVNGAIRMADNVTVSGSVEAVNGTIALDEGGSVSRNLSNINGDITLTSSTVGGDVSTINGDVSVLKGAVIKGDLEVEEASRNNSNNRSTSIPTVTIGPGSRVEGVIRLERKVKLYISDSAEVGGVEGVMSMEDAVRFSGNRP